MVDIVLDWVLGDSQFAGFGAHLNSVSIDDYLPSILVSR
jgi:hypothetical protein